MILLDSPSKLSLLVKEIDSDYIVLSSRIHVGAQMFENTACSLFIITLN